jgi:pyridoxine 5-phosphate synthase
MMKTKLSVNINAIAYVRNRRDLPWPNLIDLGRIALAAGAHGLTVHPRPDERHIRLSDLAPLRRLIAEEFPEAEFNIEGYPSADFLELCEKHLPHQVTFVPDDPAQPTSDHGWDFSTQSAFLTPLVARLKKSDMRVSLFANPDMNAHEMMLAQHTGADRLEFYTGPYGSCYNDSENASKQLNLLSQSALLAQEFGLEVNAGHDLTVDNLPALCMAIPHLKEVSIGHALTCDALQFGIENTVQRFLAALS